VITALDNLQDLRAWLPTDTINKPMLVIDASGPPTRKPTLKRLRLAEAFEWTSANILDQIVDLFQDSRVTLLPMQVIFPGLLCP